ncbi:MAG: CatA-like O-acetyltransferase [Clostridia bacterium]|jgi:chloramphenicol O-acetyltransferase type A|nr:CatA-like O-acetyltransferase [Clostridia bacterium]MCI2000923.1 CatA-like O-acetyltransferase [Clostridia bacterium]MCI2015707.1 CatA-like O-acetyltransferase [Clostridia bacterium]
MFNKIDMEKYERAEYFRYYMDLIKTKCNITVDMDITDFLKTLKNNNLKFYQSFVYAIMKSINEYPQFKMAYDKDKNLGYYDYCNPSYTIFHKDNETFSDLWTQWNDDFKTFYKDMTEDMEKYKDVKKVKAKPGRPGNFIPISNLPWLSFTSCSYDTYSESQMLFPVIIFGKYFDDNGTTKIPFTIFINHAVADGFHLCRLIKNIEETCNNFKIYM